ncbi:hypothetical protein [Methylovirgula sp. 4M-Z18]|uniref:hypothetical protein n=1 Tax=Methylovirgula sp. 4M-Z18 TaxID=2293567 RepID=UPI000E3B1CD0|nr:hypothetical protein [Methylovirgula sp. 4M-Z18]RFB78317.1 hypothetical protein DYH55_16335 [Methylovirgula sp. 4M-Z18]
MLSHLKPHLKTVTRIRKRNAHLDWGAIHARWGAVVSAAKDHMADVQSGKAVRRRIRQGAEAIIRLDERVEVSKIVDHVIAIVLLQDSDPRRFRSDAAFNAQLVRVLRKLDRDNAAAWFNHGDGKAHRAYVELSPSASRFISSLIAPALGPVGLHIAHLERAKSENERKSKDAAWAVIEQMSV